MKRCVIALSALVLLAACSGTEKTASYSSAQELSQIHWADMTAASNTAKVDNNSLISLR